MQNEHWRRLEGEENIDRLPDMIPAPEPLNWDELSELPRVAVTAAQIAEWKNDRYPLIQAGDVFLNPDGLDGEPEAWRVIAITAFKDEKKERKMYYVQTADDDEEAYGHTDEFFWDMLATSERVVRG